MRLKKQLFYFALIKLNTPTRYALKYKNGGSCVEKNRLRILLLSKMRGEGYDGIGKGENT